MTIPLPATSHRLARSAFASLLVALGTTLAADPGPAGPSQANSPGQAEAAAGSILTTQAAAWTPQSAPGFVTEAAADSERTWTALRGWVKVPAAAEQGSVPKKGKRKGPKADGLRDSGAPAETPLPDPWPRQNHPEAAWYVLRADLGNELPPSLVIRFDAVAHQCEVYVNGTHVGGHLGGFTPFSFDITQAARPGVNTVVLYVRDEHAVEFPDEGKAVSQLGVTRPGAFGSPSGICGGVYFDARASVHADHLLIHTSTRKGQIDVTTWLASPAPAGATLSQAVYRWPDGTAPVLTLPESRIAPGSDCAQVTMPWADAALWSPDHPNLYVLRTKVVANGTSETTETRFGFREFWTEGKAFILNGSPIRLLGTSLAHDLDLTIAGSPEAGRIYSRDALRFLKTECNYRAMRLHASIHPPEAIQGADEAGFLLIDQSSIWSAMGSYYNKGGEEFMKNTRAQFHEWFWRDANNPSIVIFDVENEMIRGSRAPDRVKWVLELGTFIKELDPTRIVEHSGAAWYSPDQETIHIHMKEQYNAALRAWQETGKVPLIFGEFWIGGQSGENRLTDSREHSGRLDWEQDEARLYRERILEMRNYGASGVMPFWMDDAILGRTSEALRRTYDPAKDKLYFWRYPELKRDDFKALAPVLAFAWPRSESVDQGSPLEREIVVCNDLETAADLTVRCTFGGHEQAWQVHLAPAAQDRRAIVFPRAENGELAVSVSDASGHSWSGDTVSIHALAPSREKAPALGRKLIVVPAPSIEAAQALEALGISYEASATIPTDATGTIVLVPPGQPRDALGKTAEPLRRYLTAGGRVLVLDQNEEPAWLPLNLPFWSSTSKSEPEFGMLGWPDYTRNLFYSRELPVYAERHPAFTGMTEEDFRWWNGVDGRVSDDAFIRPSALEMHTGAPYRILLGACRRENASLIEAQFGEGTALFCQAQVLEQRSAPAARALLMNLLRYLDGPGWVVSKRAIGIVGELSPARLASLVDLPREAFEPVTKDAPAPALVLAGDHSDPALVDSLALAGSTVIVLSAETAARLPGYAVSREGRFHYAGTRASALEDPLFWGISTSCFLPLEESPAKGALSKLPENARILLGGLTDELPRGVMRGHPQAIEMMGEAGPVAASESRGKGRLVVTTLEPTNPAIESHRQLLATLLANAGVSLGSETSGQADVQAKATVPIRIDGRLDDWTNDLEDRNVSPFQHAEPVALTSRDVVSGSDPADTDLSGVLYLLHDSAHLYLAGIVFSDEKPASAQFELGGHTVAVDLKNRTLEVDGHDIPGAHLATAAAAAREITDTRLLSLVAFDSHVDRFEAAPDTPGTTFEAALPWTALGVDAPPATLSGRFRIVRGQTTLQIPNASAGAASPPLTIRLGK